MATGRPIGTGAGPSSATQSWAVAQTVASVGPYSLWREMPGQAARARAGRSRGQGSPATIATRSDRQASADVSERISPRSDGTPSQCVTPSASARSASRAGSAWSPGRGITSRPPSTRVQNSPATELSKANDDVSRNAPTGSR